MERKEEGEQNYVLVIGQQLGFVYFYCAFTAISHFGKVLDVRALETLYFAGTH